MRSFRRALLPVLLAPAAAVALAACSGASTSSASPSSSAAAGASASGASGPVLTVYSGRNETLVGPLLDDLERSLGSPVEVRYGTSSELAAQLLEEGERTDADLFLSQDAGALGALAKAGRLAPLDAADVSAVAERFRDDDLRWVATSARARVVAYDPAQVPTPPASIDAVLAPEYKGKVGYAPTNASFHAFVTALRLDRGEEGARDWLQRFEANQPRAYESNALVLDAVDRGEASLGLINHYYWHAKVAEEGDAVNARIHSLPAGDPGALVNVAGVGVLAGSDAEAKAREAVRFLLSDTAQQYVADVTAEYAVVPGISSTKHDLPPLEKVGGYAVDLGDLDSLDVTLALLDEVGLT